MNKVKNKNENRFEKMPIVHLHAAGIDVGSRSHFVAIGQNKEDIREFGIYTENLHDLCKYLASHGITETALESTGSYWQPLFVLLQQYNLHPISSPFDGKYDEYFEMRTSEKWKNNGQRLY